MKPPYALFSIWALDMARAVLKQPGWKRIIARWVLGPEVAVEFNGLCRALADAGMSLDYVDTKEAGNG